MIRTTIPGRSGFPARILATAAGMILAWAILHPQAAASATTAISNGYWNVAGNWDAGVPGAGADAIIPVGRTLTNTAGTAALTSLNVAGTLVFSGWDSAVTADTIAIGGSVSHRPQGATDTNASGQWIPDHRVHFVCTNLTLAGTGSINANSMGYSGGPSSPAAGRGPGGSAGINNSGGGGHGGRGGGGYSFTAGGITYGSTSEPVAPGSGAGYSYGTIGGAGGGAVRIEATGSVTINGTISARGQNGLGSWGGCGSGGSVHIACQTFDGTGTISVVGGSSVGENYGGGGGGRIAIIYAPGPQAGVMPKPTVTLDASGGLGRTDTVTTRLNGRGEPGTVYVPNADFFPCATLIGGATVVIDGTNRFDAAALTVSNAWVRFDNAFTVRTTGPLTANGPYARIDVRNNAELECGGHLVLTNGACLYLFAGPTNGVSPLFGALVRTAGNIEVGTGSWIHVFSDSTNGGSPGLFCNNLFVRTANSGINASARGFAGGGYGYGNNGYGPGGTVAAGPALGAGHGGRGGGVGGFTGGATYGSSNAPMLPGSGSGVSHGQAGAYGGGAICVEAARDIMLNGTLSADGQNGPTSWGAGGSGGSIYLQCRVFGGSGGILTVKGGDGGGESPNAGGGGRIAIWRNQDNYSGLTTNVAGGVDNNPGAPGTIFWGVLSLPGTLIFLR